MKFKNESGGAILAFFVAMIILGLLGSIGVRGFNDWASELRAKTAMEGAIK